MRNPMAHRLSRLPFLLSAVLLVGLAGLIFVQSGRPMGAAELFACTLCVAAGAGCAVLPFVLEYRVLTRLRVADQVADAASEIRKLEQFAAQISHATALWQTVQGAADKTANQAKEIAACVAAEMKEFSEFLQSANEGEKSALRLEVEKLRRAETEWLQVLVRMLDHVYALHQAALRSGQPALIEQLGIFQNACRDTARRVGLTPFVAAPAERFDAQRHQVIEGHSKPEAGAVVDETVGTGYTFQGKLLRPALVRLRNGNGTAHPDSMAAGTRPEPDRLPQQPRQPD
jgi:molecular chaperone GrpE (heat shock protein)